MFRLKTNWNFPLEPENGCFVVGQRAMDKDFTIDSEKRFTGIIARLKIWDEVTDRESDIPG